MIATLERILNFLKKGATQESVDLEFENVSKSILRGDSIDLNPKEIARIQELFKLLLIAITKKRLDDSTLFQAWNMFVRFTNDNIG